MKVFGIGPILILIFELAASVGCHSYPRGSDPTGSTLEPIVGALDLPARGSTLRETGIVGGWAVAESGVKRIAIYIDRQFVRFVQIEGKRPDIAKLFGKDFPGAELSGWTFILDVSKMADGHHEMVAQAESNRGCMRDFGPVPFEVTH